MAQHWKTLVVYYKTSCSLVFTQRGCILETPVYRSIDITNVTYNRGQKTRKMEANEIQKGKR